MGCDIHLFIEKRLRKEDEWQADEHHVLEDGRLAEVVATARDYELFGVLANVRRSGALYPVQGLPEDTSPSILEESRGSDWHTHNWLTLRQFRNCLMKAGYSLTYNKSTDAFYSWHSTKADWDTLPESYTTVVNYCEEWIDNETAEAQLLNRTDVEPEVRIIFWFDN